MPDTFKESWFFFYPRFSQVVFLFLRERGKELGERENELGEG